ncbi:MAG: hypothetical protein HQL11_03000 [Candidatus Omnitrophica bacterium]|nr:hypothetical protein [Candidatus Omnitrophota bacterium]
MALLAAPVLAGDIDLVMTTQDGSTKVSFQDSNPAEVASVDSDGDLTVNSIVFNAGGSAVTTILDEDAMGTNSATALATQQSIKAYVDSAFGTANGISALAVIADNSVIRGDGGERGAQASGVSIDDTGNLTIGAGTADIDYTLTFNGETSDGVLTWMEDDDYLLSADTLLFADSTAVKFGTGVDSSILFDGDSLNITANAGTVTDDMVFTADQYTLNTQADTDLGITFTGTTNTGVLTWMEDENYFSMTALKLATGGTYATQILDEDAMGTNSDTALATQQSIKAYVDSASGGISRTLQQVYEADADGGDATIALTAADGSVVISNADATTGSAYMVKLDQDDTAGVIALQIEQAGTSDSVLIDHNSTGNALNIDADANAAGDVYGLRINAANAGAGAAYSAVFETGYVGIGTDAPHDNLTVVDSVTLMKGGGSTNTLYFADGATAPNTYVGNITYNHDVNSMSFVVNENQRILIDSNGDVGIGTSAPDGVLEVNMGVGKEVRLSYNDANGSATDYAKFTLADDGGLTITTVDADAASADIALMPDGNVGIGTASPVTKLTTEGTITLKEQAAADADTAAYGQIWVKSDVPNTLWFTNDAGTDTQLGAGGAFDSTAVDATTWSDGSNAANVWTFDVSGTDHTMTAGNGIMTFSHDVSVGGSLKQADSDKHYFGDADDSYIEFDGDSLNITANTVTAGDDLELTADSLTLTTGGTGDSEVILPNDSIGPNEIDSTTGAYDFGSVTSFKIPTSDGPTVNAIGLIAVDTSGTPDQLVYYDGTAARVALHDNTKTMVIEDPTDADNFLFFRPERGVTVTGIDCLCQGGTSPVITVQECNGNGGGCGATEAAITCGTTNTSESGGIDDSAIDAGDWVRVDVGAVTGVVDHVAVSVTYREAVDAS